LSCRVPVAHLEQNGEQQHPEAEYQRRHAPNDLTHANKVVQSWEATFASRRAAACRWSYSDIRSSLLLAPYLIFPTTRTCPSSPQPPSKYETGNRQQAMMNPRSIPLRHS
jgi:hypothetical protein